MTRLKFLITLLLLLFSWQVKSIDISENTVVSILTCSPGGELYSTFGHTAIRFQTTVNGQDVDVVYNYGTFEFDDYFVVKFIQGKLKYMLSRQSFPAFQYGYIVENRSIKEQILALNQAEKQRLFDLLEENFLPENRYYIYDYFYDNCSTRVRDILKKALGSDLHFSEWDNEGVSFRDMIQPYLSEQAWGDFGIDLAMGLPADKKLQTGDEMFLPDFLYDQFDLAEYKGKPIVYSSEEILLKEDNSSDSKPFTPNHLFWILLIVYLSLTAYFILKKKKSVWMDNMMLFIAGLMGFLLLFIWFATDHGVGQNNLNILWAIPFNLVLPFLSLKKQWVSYYFIAQSILLFLVLVSWTFIPQDYHSAFIPFVILLLIASLKKLILSRV